MQNLPNRRRLLQFSTAVFLRLLRAGIRTAHRSLPASLLVSLSPLLLVSSSPAHADIFQWEYIDPADPSRGKRQSTTLCIGGAGVEALPGADLFRRNLAMAYLIGAELRNASFYGAWLVDADFTDATVQGARFDIDFSNVIPVDVILPFPIESRPIGSGITLTQLYSTASYRAADLSDISLRYNDLTGANFAGQNLSNVDFSGAALTGANFNSADVQGAKFVGTSLTLAKLYTTASYQKRDLRGISWFGADVSDGDLAHQNLTNAQLPGAVLSGTDFTGALVAAANFAATTDSGFTAAQLYSTASYQVKELPGIVLHSNNLSGWNFAEQNLANANFFDAILTGANFTGADVRGANFDKGNRGGTGISLAQLYSTASYQMRDLSGMRFDQNNFTGAKFSNLNLADSVFAGASLRAADLSHAKLNRVFFAGSRLDGTKLLGADARGAQSFNLAAGTIAANMIFPDGRINGLNLGADATLTVHNYDGNASPIPIYVVQHMTMGPGGRLRMVFEADEWNSTISFATGIPVTLGGTLELTFADNVNLASQLGRTFDLFDWTGVHPVGQFTVASPYHWNLANLYTTGEVTLTAVPEPTPLVPIAVLGLTFLRRRNLA